MSDPEQLADDLDRINTELLETIQALDHPYADGVGDTVVPALAHLADDIKMHPDDYGNDS